MYTYGYCLQNVFFFHLSTKTIHCMIFYIPFRPASYREPLHYIAVITVKALKKRKKQLLMKPDHIFYSIKCSFFILIKGKFDLWEESYSSVFTHTLLHSCTVCNGENKLFYYYKYWEGWTAQLNSKWNILINTYSLIFIRSRNTIFLGGCKCIYVLPLYWVRPSI